MKPLFHLYPMLSEYQQVFKYSANFNHFPTHVICKNVLQSQTGRIWYEIDAQSIRMCYSRSIICTFCMKINYLIRYFFVRARQLYSAAGWVS